MNGCMNPADCVSRGVSASNFLRDQVWMSGPGFLLQPVSHWPKGPELTLTLSDPEVKVLAVSVSTPEDCSDTVNKLRMHYSQWHRLKKAVAWVLRIKAVLRASLKNNSYEKESLSVENLQRAEAAIIEFCQSTSFMDEMNALKKGFGVKTSSHLHKFSPII